MLYLSAFLGAKTIAKVETFFRNKVKKTIFFRAQKTKKNAQKLAYFKRFYILQKAIAALAATAIKFVNIHQHKFPRIFF